MTLRAAAVTAYLRPYDYFYDRYSAYYRESFAARRAGPRFAPGNMTLPA